MAETTPPPPSPAGGSSAPWLSRRTGPVPNYMLLGLGLAAVVVGWKWYQARQGSTSSSTGGSPGSPGGVTAVQGGPRINETNPKTTRKADQALRAAQAAESDVKTEDGKRLAADKRHKDQEDKRFEELQDEIDGTRKAGKNGTRTSPVAGDNADHVTTVPVTSNGKTPVSQPQTGAASDVNLTTGPSATPVRPPGPHTATTIGDES